MPVPRKPRPLGRYALALVIQEFEEQFRRRKRGSRTHLAYSIGFKPPEITKRQDDIDAHWNIEDIGRIADAWGAPPGWPFIPWDEAWERDKAWRDELDRRKQQVAAGRGSKK